MSSSTFGKTEVFPECNASVQTLFNDLVNNKLTQQLPAAARDMTLRPLNCYVQTAFEDTLVDWTLADPNAVAFFGYAFYEARSTLFLASRIAGDSKLGIQDTTSAKVEPSPYTIIDGSYAVLRRPLFINVDILAWPLVYNFMAYGFSAAGQQDVLKVGYVAVNADLYAKMLQRIQQRGNFKAD